MHLSVGRKQRTSVVHPLQERRGVNPQHIINSGKPLLHSHMAPCITVHICHNVVAYAQNKLVLRCNPKSMVATRGNLWLCVRQAHSFQNGVSRC